VLQTKERAPIPCSSVVFCLGLTFESLKELGARQVVILLMAIDGYSINGYWWLFY